MFNFIIAEGMTVRFKKVDINNHIFMGTPAEYTDFLGRDDV